MDFSGIWPKISPWFGSSNSPEKPLISRKLYHQTRMASRKIRTPGGRLKNGLKNGKMERIWEEKREFRRELQPLSRQ